MNNNIIELSCINKSLKIHFLIYKITNNINGKYYIGQHKTEDPYDDYMGSGRLMLKALKKYDLSCFTKEILFDFDNFDDMNNKEKELVPLSACYPNNPMSYNLREGGFNGTFTDDMRKHWSSIRKGMFAGKNNPMYGIDVRTLMTKDAIKEMSRKRSIALKNRKRKQETFDKISKANSGKNNPMYGRKGKLAPHYGKKCMSNNNTNKIIYVDKEQVPLYLEQGFSLKGNRTGTKCTEKQKAHNRQMHLGRKVLINKSTNHKVSVFPKDFKMYLDLGYVFVDKKYNYMI